MIFLGSHIVYDFATHIDYSRSGDDSERRLRHSFSNPDDQKYYSVSQDLRYRLYLTNENNPSFYSNCRKRN